MERKKYNIKNSRVWHLCSLELEQNQRAILDNWSKYTGEVRETFYLNEKDIFLEVDHFNKTFKLFNSKLRKNNIDDFKRYYRDYLKYQEIK